MSLKVRKNTGLVILMAASLFAFQQYRTYQNRITAENRLFSADPFVQENRPAHRKHPYGGTLIWGARQEPSMINPILLAHTVSMDLAGILFNRLLRINSTGALEPDLAEKWEISEDGLNYTFYLRKGIKFHDGAECTAEDIQFTYHQLMDPQNNSPHRSHFDLVKKIEVPARHTLKITLSKPFPPLLFKLADREIVPKHLLAGEDLHTTSFNYHPIGTGPFKFKSWDRKTHQINLTANPDYFEGRPYLDNIIVKIYSDGSQLWSALMRQEIDLMLYVKKDDFRIIEEDSAYKTYTIPWNKYCAVAYNLDNSILSDHEIRKAIAFGINKKEIMETISMDSVGSTGPFHPDSAGFNPHVKPFEYNPIRAKMTLMHRGWKDVNGDGILEKNFRDLKIKMLVNGKNHIHKKIAMIIRQQLAEIGIKIELIPYRDEVDLTKEFLEKNKPQAWLRFFDGTGFYGYDAAHNWYSSSSEFGRIWDYKNDKVDQFFESGRAGENEKKSQETYENIHEIIYADQPACFLFFPSILHVVSAKFMETDSFFNTYMPVYTMKNWYMLSN